MSDTKPTTEPTLEEALIDIQTLASVALRSDDMTVVKRDLEMILAIVDTVLPPRRHQ